MNKLLEGYLSQEPEYVYAKAKKLVDSMSTFCAIHGWTKKMEGADALNAALDNLPREDEVAVNLRFKKDLIKNDPTYAEFVSTLFDLVEMYNNSKEATE